MDPLRTKIAEQADLHLAFLPAPTCCWLVGGGRTRTIGRARSAFISEHVLGDDEFMAGAGVARSARRQPVDCRQQIVNFAQWLAEADPLVFAPGNGLERGRNGGSGIRALIALPALLGKLGKGSGIILGASNAFPKTPARLQRPDLAPEGTRTLNLIEVGRHLVADDIDPPLRALFVYNHNPIVVHPDQNRMRRVWRATMSSRSVST